MQKKKLGSPPEPEVRVRPDRPFRVRLGSVSGPFLSMDQNSIILTENGNISFLYVPNTSQKYLRTFTRKIDLLLIVHLTGPFTVRLRSVRTMNQPTFCTRRNRGVSALHVPIISEKVFENNNCEF